MSIRDLEVDVITRGNTGDIRVAVDVEADGVPGFKMLEKVNGHRVSSSITS